MKLTDTTIGRFFAISRIAPAALAVAASLIPGVASANNQILVDSCNTVLTIKNWIFGVAYLLAAIGLVVIAVSAFLGRFKFSHLIALGGGLFVIAGADLLIRFVTSGDSTGTACVIS